MIAVATVLLAFALAPFGAAVPASSGNFNVLSYNVAGLPAGLSSSNPSVNTPQISPRLAPYNIVHVQEDFNSHAALYASDNHPYRTPTSGGAGIGQGLNSLSVFPYDDFERHKWGTCSDASGADCLTPKGFTSMRVQIDEGIRILFINLHADAGTENGDLSARRSNIDEVANYITANAAGDAVLVFGDTNTRYTRSGDNIRDLASIASMTDAWVELIRSSAGPPTQGADALVCPDPPTNDCEVVDKIWYKGSRYLQLKATYWNDEDAKFRDASNKMLSDHSPITAGISWTLAEDLRKSNVFGGPHGDFYDDALSLPSPPNAVAVTSITVRSGSRVDQLRLSFSSGAQVSHGGSGGSDHTLSLASGEYPVSVELHEGEKDGHTRIFFAKFTTNLGRSVSGGSTTSDKTVFTAPSGWKIGGVYGRSGDELDKVGMVYVRI
ncbi:putative secreted protein [Rickenella mellea]|uniref:Putative secreted protein n=1 Tax=Rickenella mellea TaxID=50990 RepID=A0A4Y7Q1N5_9AGAM|nr:putative secreted protein [Rickenella mellea]